MLIQPRGHHTPFGLPSSGGCVVVFESFALESDSVGLNPNSIMYLLCDLRQITLPPLSFRFLSYKNRDNRLLVAVLKHGFQFFDMPFIDR